MNECLDTVKTTGEVEITITDIFGNISHKTIRNSVLNTGREAHANSLANNVGDSYNFFMSQMVFGTGGSVGGSPKVVNADQGGLFNQIISKSVIANVDPNLPSQVVFTAVLGSTDPSSTVALNEMGLQMNNGQLYSMSTFADINKTTSMQITFAWRISFC